MPIVKCQGLIRQSMTGHECTWIEETQGVEVRNGSKTILVTLKIGQLSGDILIIIDLDLFKPLGYESRNVPILFPKKSEKVKLQ